VHNHSRPDLAHTLLDFYARLTGREERRFFFRMRIDRPDAYPLKLRIRSSDLYRELALDCVLQVRALASLPMRDAISTLIDRGESLRDRIPEQCRDEEIGQ